MFVICKAVHGQTGKGSMTAISVMLSCNGLKTIAIITRAAVDGTPSQITLGSMSHK